MAVTCARPAASAVRAAWLSVVRASRPVRRAAFRVWRALDCASRCWRVAAARRAEALRAVLVRERLALVARRVFERVPVERVPVERVPVERVLVERLEAERLLPLFERVVLVRRVELELRRALLRFVLPVFWAMVVLIPPPRSSPRGKDISSKDNRSIAANARS
jgi:hypothetical protein